LIARLCLRAWIASPPPEAVVIGWPWQRPKRKRRYFPSWCTWYLRREDDTQRCPGPHSAAWRHFGPMRARQRWSASVWARAPSRPGVEDARLRAVSPPPSPPLLPELDRRRPRPRSLYADWRDHPRELASTRPVWSTPLTAASSPRTSALG